MKQGLWKERSRNSNTDNKEYEGVPDLLKGVGFTIARYGPDLYLKAVKWLGLYVCATYKNGSDLEMCLEAEEMILPEELVLPENPRVNQWKMWDVLVSYDKKWRNLEAKHPFTLCSLDVTMWL